MTDNSRTAGAARRFWLRQVSWRGMALVAAISLLMGIVQATAAWSEQGPTEAVIRGAALGNRTGHSASCALRRHGQAVSGSILGATE
jgi:hypothetical protein